MFRKSAEQQIMREADRIVSMKEDVDAMSWGRVTEIAKLLQVDHTEEQRLEWARELLSIARTNSWVLDKFGVAAESMTGQVIPSGIEIQQGDRYLNETAAGDLPSAGEQPSAADGAKSDSRVFASTDPLQPEPGARMSSDAARDAYCACEDTEPKPTANPAVSLPDASASDATAFAAQTPAAAVQDHAPAARTPAPAAQAPTGSAPEAQPSAACSPSVPASVASAPAASVSGGTAPEAIAPEASVIDGSFIETKGMLRKKRRAEKRAQREQRDAEAFIIPTARPADDAVFGFEQIATPALGQDATSLDELRGAKPQVQAESASMQAEESTSEPPDSIDPRSAGRSEQTADGRSEEAAPGQSPQDFARFKHLYSNKKGSLCLYEDADGHLVAVDPSRFA